MNKILLILGTILLLSCTSTPKLFIGEQSKQIMEKEITIKIESQYWLYLPKNYEQDQTEWPLMLFLHGAGERGNDLKKVKIHGPPKLVQNGKHFPFIIISPQCPEEQWWSSDILDLLLKDVSKKYRIDENRIYVTGLSMGGYGTWDLAIKYPNRFAAIAPVCGGGDPTKASVLKDLPIWVFHGAKDEVVTLDKSQVMVDAIEKTGGSVKFTIYPEANHDSWTETYNNPELYEWFLAQSREAK